MGKLQTLARRFLGAATGQPEPIELLARNLADLVRQLPTDLDGQVEAELLDRVPGLLAQVDAANYIERVPSYAKVAYHHIRHNNLQALHLAVNRGLLDLKRHSAALDDGHPVVHLPGWEDPTIARDNFVLSISQTQLATEVVRIRIIGDQVEAVIRAGFVNIDADGAVPKLRVLTEGVVAKFVGETSGHRGGAASWRETFDRSTWSVLVPLAKFGPEQALELELEATLAGRVAAGRVALASPAEPDGPAIDRITIERQVLLIEGRGLSRAPILVSDSVQVEASDFTHLGTRFRVEFPVTADRWGQGELPLPIGDYEVLADGDSVPLAVELVNWPTDFVGESLVGHTTTSGLRLIRPRRRDENTRYGQRALREAYAQTVSTLQEAALFQCRWAEAAVGNQAAIHREFHRRNPRMKLYWGVADHSVAVPAGATALVVGTREWYAALASVKYLVKSTEVGAYTVLRPGQIYLQTFEGQPFEQLGRAALARTMPAWRAAYEAVERRAAFWDVICLPYPEAADFYQDAFDWDGRTFDQGLPSTDGLLAPNADVVRRATREKFEIASHQQAVLFAPSSADHERLDVDRLADSLGGDFVILLRGERLDASSPRRTGQRAGIVDVTNYPEINDLILASDVAVLSDSSIRFDYAITKKPMIFLSPDFEHHQHERGPDLFSFVESAPGPIVEHVDQLPGLLRDFSWAQKHQGEYAAFNERFNKFHDGHAAERVVDGLLGWGS